jgi:hypothetical protein
MEHISNILRDLTKFHLKEASIKDVISYETKRHFGGPELIYVTSKEHKEPLETLTGTKTLTDRHVKALKDMGFTFKRDVKEQSEI